MWGRQKRYVFFCIFFFPAFALVALIFENLAAISLFPPLFLNYISLYLYYYLCLGEHLIVHEYTNAILNRKEEQLHFAQLFRDFQYSSIMKLHEMEVGEAEEIFEVNKISPPLLLLLF